MISFTSLPGVDGICTMFRDQFLGLSLFCYNEPGDDGPQARIGFAGLRYEFNNLVGPPIEVWGTGTEPACSWEPGLLMIEMYCFQRLSSGVLVGLSDAERAAAHNSAMSALTDRMRP